jgi:hypothetical protein
LDGCVGEDAIILIRGTQKLLKRLGKQSSELNASTNALGDWYATLVYVGRIQLILCTSANSLLSVVFEARRVKTQIAESLCKGLETLLFDIGASESQVRAELEQMRDYQVGPTASRNVLGTMNDFTQSIYYRINEQPEVTLQQINLDLSGTPCKGPRGYIFPSERARMLLENWHRECDSTRQ